MDFKVFEIDNLERGNEIMDTIMGSADTLNTTLSSGSALETVSSNHLIVNSNYSGDLWMTSAHIGNLLTNTSGTVHTNDSIITIDASRNSNNMVIVGNSNSNSIKGSSGKNTIWGGGYGNDTLVGGSNRDQFWYDGRGNDVVESFAVGSSSSSDVVVLAEGSLSNISRSGSTVSVNMSNGSSIQLQTNSSSDDNVILYSVDGSNIYQAKIGSADSLNGGALTYNSDVNYYQTTDGGSILVSGSSEANVWLDGSAGQIYSGIKNIYAESTGNNVLVGDGQSNVISANVEVDLASATDSLGSSSSLYSGGSSTINSAEVGQSSLYGGSGGNDTLIGGNGTDTFWFGKNDGTDVIQNASSSDTVRFYDVNLSEITSYNVSSEGNVSVGFNSGASLQVQGTSDNLTSTFQFSNGQKFNFNKSTRSWQAVS